MTTININEAKTHLSRYARRVKDGETIVLCDRNIPFAEIRPLSPKSMVKKRKLGQLKGKIQFDEDSFWAADKEIEAQVLGSRIFPETRSR